MIFLGLFFVGFGVFSLLQARLPRERRKIFPRGSKPWKDKAARPLGKYSCICFGIFCSVVGVYLSLEALSVIHVDGVYQLLGSIPLFLIMIVGVILDDVKKEPNQPPEPTRQAGGSS